MTRLPNPSRGAAAFARSAQHELNQLRQALRAAQDNIAGLHHAIRTPNLRARRRTIRGSREGASSLLGMGGEVLGGFLGTVATGSSAGLDSFYRSASQAGAKLAALSVLGQRIR